MTWGELATLALTHKLNVGANDYLSPAKRARASFHGNALVHKAFPAYPWPWKLGAGTVSLTAGAGVVPADFSNPGRRMKVFLTSSGAELVYRTPDDLLSMRTSTPQVGTPRYYTLRGQTAGRQGVQVWPTNATVTSLSLENYVVKVPRLVDYPDKPVAAQGAAGALTGVYRWRLTSIHADGETEGGEVSLPLTLAARAATLTFPTRLPDRSVTSWGIYRTAASGDTFGKVAEALVGTSTYTDNTADGARGVAPPTVDTAITGLERIPSDWHDGVMFDGLVGRLERDQGDVRSAEKDQAFLAGLRTMWMNERPGLNTTRRMPRYRAVANRI